MKKALFLMLIPTVLSAMQAPRGLTMDRATQYAQECAQQVSKATSDCIDQTFCCGCYEDKMQKYLRKEKGGDFYIGDADWLTRGERTAYGCLCYNYYKDLDQSPPCDPLIGSFCLGGCGANVCSIAAEVAPIAPVPTLCAAAVPVGVFALFKRRFDNVKAKVLAERHND
jgi:hypothetical protein